MDGQDEIDEAASAEAIWAEEADIRSSAQRGRNMTASSSSRLLKGEGVDVSLPTRRDVNLQMWCHGEAAEPGSFVSYKYDTCNQYCFPTCSRPSYDCVPTAGEASNTAG